MKAPSSTTPTVPPTEVTDGESRLPYASSPPASSIDWTAARTSASCSSEARAPMVTPSARGSPTTTRSLMRAPMAAATSEVNSLGTSTRRMAVHFWPALTVISVTTALTKASNSGVPGRASGPRMAAFSESVSEVKRTPPCTTLGCDFSDLAVAAEPVKDTRSR